MTIASSKKTIDEMVNYWKTNFMSFHELKALENSSRALEKQMPVNIEFDDNDLNICPICKNHVKTDDNYCWSCGQRIVLK